MLRESGNFTGAEFYFKDRHHFCIKKQSLPSPNLQELLAEVEAKQGKYHASALLLVTIGKIATYSECLGYQNLSSLEQSGQNALDPSRQRCDGFCKRKRCPILMQLETLQPGPSSCEFPDPVSQDFLHRIDIV